jgi:lipid IVA palmitoyltransferase
VPFPIARVAAAGLALVLACTGATARAKDESWSCERAWSWLKSNCEGARDAWRGDDYDLYFSGLAHHGRGTYSAEKIKTFNEKAWGGGLGKRYVDSDRHTHLLYAMAFKDSHFKPEYMAGYGWLTHWYPFDAGGPRLGLGFTTFITLRSDYSHYLFPVPGILPLAELGWSRASLMAAYVPRLSGNGGNGDVLMLFGKISF